MFFLGKYIYFRCEYEKCSIVSPLAAIKGSPSKFDLFAFGQALSSQPTP